MVQKRLASNAKLLQSSEEADLKDIQSRRQPFASTPDGPASPSILRAAVRIASPSSRSRITGWGSCARGVSKISG